MLFPRLASRAATTSKFFTSGRSFLVSNNAATTALSRKAVATTPAITMNMMRYLSTSNPNLPEDKTITNPDMFCRQCEQTRDHYACTTVGVCGKSSEVAAIQDTLIHLVKSVSTWAVAARAEGVTEEQLADVNLWTLQATFSTLTNVNFSEARIEDYCREGMEHQAKLRGMVQNAPTASIASLDLSHCSDASELEQFGVSIQIPKRLDEALGGNEDALSLGEIATYGLKGVCAYAAHCYQLGSTNPDVFKNIHECFATVGSDTTDINVLLANALKVGETNTTVLAMLDQAHADEMGVPEPTQVRTTAVEGKAILISGHDMMDLYHLLKATEGTGVNVYTHGEMLPAHGYPKLKAFKHLVGNYGTAWQNQKFEFAGFPGPIIMTTNCVLEPRKMYRNRLYTMNEVGVDNVNHIGHGRDYSNVIDQALGMKGFKKTVDPAKYVTVGFNHRVVLPLAGQIIEAAQSGNLSRIFLIGGCDGTQWERSYFTELAENTPEDSLILTLGCAKNRIIHSEKLDGATLGDSGIPRVIDMGQCNDSYSAVVVAQELAKALNCGINDLPLSLAISHLEQKAAACLLTLLSLGVKNIRLGPSLPSYVSPGVLQVLSDNYNLMPVSTSAQEDLEQMMAGK